LRVKATSFDVAVLELKVDCEEMWSAVNMKFSSTAKVPNFSF